MRWAGSRSWTRSSKKLSNALAQDGNKDGQDRGRGIELVDVGLSRIEFVPEVREAAFGRAVSLMEAIATKTISEGEQRKKEIINKTQAEVQKIEGEGKQEANILKGKADADIIDSYAKAIRESGDFYNFVRTLEAYKEAFKSETRLILTTESSLLRLIKKLEPEARVQAKLGGRCSFALGELARNDRCEERPLSSSANGPGTLDPIPHCLRPRMGSNGC